jgi:hypothetical protein
LADAIQFLLDAQELVVLRDTVAAAHGAGLDLAAVRGDGEVGDGVIFGLTGAMAHDGGVTMTVGEIDGVEVSVREPIWFTFTRMEFATPRSMPFWRNSTLVTKRSSPTSWVVAPISFGDDVPACPVAFGAAVFDGDDRELLLQLGVVGHEFGGGALGLVGLLEDVLVLGLVVELGGGHVEGDEDVLTELVAGLVHGLGDDFEGVVGALERRGEATFVTDGGAEAEVVQDFLQRVEDSAP